MRNHLRDDYLCYCLCPFFMAEYLFCCGDCAFEIKVYFNQTKFHPAPDCLMGLGNEASVMHPLVCLCKMIKLLQGCYDNVVGYLHPPFLQHIHAWSFQYLCHTILPLKSVANLYYLLDKFVKPFLLL